MSPAYWPTCDEIAEALEAFAEPIRAHGYAYEGLGIFLDPYRYAPRAALDRGRLHAAAHASAMRRFRARAASRPAPPRQVPFSPMLHALYVENNRQLGIVEP
jgi:hypothetical protein